MPKKPKTDLESVLLLINEAKTLMPQDALPLLAECAHCGHSYAAVRAVDAIGKLDLPESIPMLIELYEYFNAKASDYDNKCDVRIKIVEYLGGYGSAIKVLTRAIKTVHIVRLGPGPDDMATGLRAVAAVQLAKTDPDCLHELAFLLFDEKPNVPTAHPAYAKADVRIAAAQAMSVLGDAGALPLLAVKLKFPEREVPEVLAECLEAFIFMKPHYVMDIVMPYLQGHDNYIASIAAIALAQNYRETVLDLLIEIAENAVGEFKQALAVAISQTRCARAKNFLMTMCDDPSKFARLGAVIGLKSYLDDDVRAKLKAMQHNDPDQAVRMECVL